MIQKTTMLGVLVNLIPLASSAAPVPRFADFLENQVSSVEKAMSSQDSATRPPEFELYQFLLKVSPEVGFDIPGFANVQVAPEIALIWEKVEAKPAP